MTKSKLKEKIENKDKIKVATACLGGCSGCHMSFLDNDEYIIELLDQVELDASHMIVDHKEFSEVDIGIVEGTMTNEENLEVAEDLREKSDILLAWGDCACLGGIMTMRNFDDVDEVIKECFKEKADDKSEIPNADSIPTLLDQADPVNQYLEVDAYLPGCPPTADVIGYGFKELLKGNKPKATGLDLQYD